MPGTLSLGKNKGELITFNIDNIRAGIKRDELLQGIDPKMRSVFVQILDQIDTNPDDNMLSRSELQAFFEKLKELAANKKDETNLSAGEAKEFQIADSKNPGKTKNIGGKGKDALFALLNKLTELSKDVKITKNEDGSETNIYPDGRVETVQPDGAREVVIKKGNKTTITKYDKDDHETERDEVIELPNNAVLTESYKNNKKTKQHTLFPNKRDYSEITFDDEEKPLKQTVHQDSEVKDFTYDENQPDKWRLDKTVKTTDAETITIVMNYSEHFVKNGETETHTRPGSNEPYKTVKKTYGNNDGNTVLNEVIRENGQPEKLRTYTSAEDRSYTEEYDKNGVIYTDSYNAEGKKTAQTIVKDGALYEVNYDEKGYTNGIIVQNGETIQSIADKFGVEARVLVAANTSSLNSKRQFDVGAEIKIPRQMQADEEVLQGRKDKAGAIAEHRAEVARKNAEVAARRKAERLRTVGTEILRGKNNYYVTETSDGRHLYWREKDGKGEQISAKEFSQHCPGLYDNVQAKEKGQTQRTRKKYNTDVISRQASQVARDIRDQISGVSINSNTIKILQNITSENASFVITAYHRQYGISLAKDIDNESGLDIKTVKEYVCKPLAEQAKKVGLKLDSSYAGINNISDLKDWMTDVSYKINAIMCNTMETYFATDDEEAVRRKEEKETKSKNEGAILAKDASVSLRGAQWNATGIKAIQKMFLNKTINDSNIVAFLDAYNNNAENLNGDSSIVDAIISETELGNNSNKKQLLGYIIDVLTIAARKAGVDKDTANNLWREFRDELDKQLGFGKDSAVAAADAQSMENIINSMLGLIKAAKSGIKVKDEDVLADMQSFAEDNITSILGDITQEEKSIAKDFYDIVDHNKGSESMRKLKELINSRITSDNVVGVITAYNQAGGKKQDKDIIDSILSESHTDGTPTIDHTAKTYVAAGEAYDVINALVDKLLSKAKVVGVPERFLQEARTEWMQEMYKLKVSDNSKFDEHQIHNNYINKLIDLIGGKDVGARGAYEDARAADSCFGEFLDSFLGFSFGWKTMAEMEAKLGSNVQSAKELMDIANKIKNAKPGDDIDQLKADFIRIYESAFPGAKYDPKVMAARAKMQSRVATVAVNNELSPVFTKALAASDEAGIKAALNQCKTVMGVGDDNKKMYLTEFVEAKVVAYIEMYKVAGKTVSRVDAYKAILTQTKTAYQNEANQALNGSTYEQMRIDLEQLNQAAYGSSNLGKEVAKFNENQAMTETYGELVLDVAATVATCWIPGVGEAAGLKLTATMAKLATKIPKYAKIFNTIAKVGKGITTVSKGAKTIQSGNVLTTAKNGTRLARVTNAVLTRTIAGAYNAVNAGVTVTGLHLLEGHNWEDSFEAGKGMAMFAGVATGASLAASAAAQIASKLGCTLEVAQKALAFVVEQAINLGYANMPIVESYMEEKGIKSVSDMTTADWWEVITSDESILNNTMMLAMTAVTHITEAKGNKQAENNISSQENAAADVVSQTAKRATVDGTRDTHVGTQKANQVVDEILTNADLATPKDLAEARLQAQYLTGKTGKTETVTTKNGKNAGNTREVVVEKGENLRSEATRNLDEAAKKNLEEGRWTQAQYDEYLRLNKENTVKIADNILEDTHRGINPSDARRVRDSFEYRTAEELESVIEKLEPRKGHYQAGVDHVEQLIKEARALLSKKTAARADLVSLTKDLDGCITANKGLDGNVSAKLKQVLPKLTDEADIEAFIAKWNKVKKATNADKKFVEDTLESKGYEKDASGNFVKKGSANPAAGNEESAVHTEETPRTEDTVSAQRGAANPTESQNFDLNKEFPQTLTKEQARTWAEQNNVNIEIKDLPNGDLLIVFRNEKGLPTRSASYDPSTGRFKHGAEQVWSVDGKFVAETEVRPDGSKTYWININGGRGEVSPEVYAKYAEEVKAGHKGYLTEDELTQRRSEAEAPARDQVRPVGETPAPKSFDELSQLIESLDNEGLTKHVDNIIDTYLDEGTPYHRQEHYDFLIELLHSKGMDEQIGRLHKYGFKHSSNSELQGIGECISSSATESVDGQKNSKTKGNTHQEPVVEEADIEVINVEISDYIDENITSAETPAHKQKREQIREQIEKDFQVEITNLKNTAGKEYYDKLKWENIIPENALPQEIKNILEKLLIRNKIRKQIEKDFWAETTNLKNALGKNTRGEDFYNNLKWENIIPKDALPQEIQSILRDLNTKAKSFTQLFTLAETYGRNFDWAQNVLEIQENAVNSIREGKSVFEVTEQIADGYGGLDKKGADAKRAEYSGQYRPDYVPNSNPTTPCREGGKYGAYYEPFNDVVSNNREIPAPYKDAPMTKLIKNADGSITMLHPLGKDVPIAMKHVETLYNKLKPMIEKVQSGGELTKADIDLIYDIVPEIDYSLSHAMPWARGSNGIVDTYVRAIYKSLGFDMPVLKHNVSLDLEAFCTDLPTFKRNWREQKFFEATAVEVDGAPIPGGPKPVTETELANRTFANEAELDKFMAGYEKKVVGDGAKRKYVYFEGSGEKFEFVKTPDGKLKLKSEMNAKVEPEQIPESEPVNKANRYEGKDSSEIIYDNAPLEQLSNEELLIKYNEMSRDMYGSRRIRNYLNEERSRWMDTYNHDHKAALKEIEAEMSKRGLKLKDVTPEYAKSNKANRVYEYETNSVAEETPRAKAEQNSTQTKTQNSQENVSQTETKGQRDMRLMNKTTSDYAKMTPEELASEYQQLKEAEKGATSNIRRQDGTYVTKFQKNKDAIKMELEKRGYSLTPDGKLKLKSEMEASSAPKSFDELSQLIESLDNEGLTKHVDNIIDTYLDEGTPYHRQEHYDFLIELLHSKGMDEQIGRLHKYGFKHSSNSELQGIGERMSASVKEPRPESEPAPLSEFSEDELYAELYKLAEEPLFDADSGKWILTSENLAKYNELRVEFERRGIKFNDYLEVMNRPHSPEAGRTPEERAANAKAEKAANDLETKVNDAFENNFENFEELADLTPAERELLAKNYSDNPQTLVMFLKGEKPSAILTVSDDVMAVLKKLKSIDAVTVENYMYVINRNQVKDIISNNKELFEKRLGLSENSSIDEIYSALLGKDGLLAANKHDVLGLVLGYPKTSTMIFELEHCIPNGNFAMRYDLPRFKKQLVEALYSENSPYKNMSNEFKADLEHKINSMTEIREAKDILGGFEEYPFVYYVDEPLEVARIRGNIEKTAQKLDNASSANHQSEGTGAKAVNSEQKPYTEMNDEELFGEYYNLRNQMEYSSPSRSEQAAIIKKMREIENLLHEQGFEVRMENGEPRKVEKASNAKANENANEGVNEGVNKGSNAPSSENAGLSDDYVLRKFGAKMHKAWVEAKEYIKNIKTKEAYESAKSWLKSKFPKTTELYNDLAAFLEKQWAKVKLMRKPVDLYTGSKAFDKQALFDFVNEPLPKSFEELINNTKAKGLKLIDQNGQVVNEVSDFGRYVGVLRAKDMKTGVQYHYYFNKGKVEQKICFAPNGERMIMSADTNNGKMYVSIDNLKNKASLPFEKSLTEIKAEQFNPMPGGNSDGVRWTEYTINNASEIPDAIGVHLEKLPQNIQEEVLAALRKGEDYSVVLGDNKYVFQIKNNKIKVTEVNTSRAAGNSNGTGYTNTRGKINSTNFANEAELKNVISTKFSNETQNYIINNLRNGKAFRLQKADVEYHFSVKNGKMVMDEFNIQQKYNIHSRKIDDNTTETTYEVSSNDDIAWAITEKRRLFSQQTQNKIINALKNNQTFVCEKYGIEFEFSIDANGKITIKETKLVRSSSSKNRAKGERQQAGRNSGMSETTKQERINVIESILERSESIKAFKDKLRDILGDGFKYTDDMDMKNFHKKCIQLKAFWHTDKGGNPPAELQVLCEDLNNMSYGKYVIAGQARFGTAEEINQTLDKIRSLLDIDALEAELANLKL